MNNPTTSFNVVINVPKPKLILYLFKSNGITKPKMAATTITVNNDARQPNQYRSLQMQLQYPK